MKRYLLFGMFVSLLFFSAVSSQAQNCNALVEDRVSVLGDGISEVESAAKALKSIGVEVRVRVIETFGDAGTLENYFLKDMKNYCVSWQSPDGGLKNNMLFLVHSKKEVVTAIISGSQWKVPIDANYVRIITDFIAPKIHNGDYAGGLALGVRELHRVLYAHLHPGSSDKTILIDAGNLSRTVIISVFALIFVVLTVMGYMRFMGHREKKEAIEDERLVAISAKNQASDLLLRRDRLVDVLKQRQEEARAAASPWFETSIREIIEKYNSAWDDYNLNEAEISGFDPHDKNLPLAQYVRLAKVYTDILDKIKRADMRCKLITKIEPDSVG